MLRWLLAGELLSRLTLTWNIARGDLGAVGPLNHSHVLALLLLLLADMGLCREWRILRSFWNNLLGLGLTLLMGGLGGGGLSLPLGGYHAGGLRGDLATALWLLALAGGHLALRVRCRLRDVSLLNITELLSLPRLWKVPLYLSGPPSVALWVLRGAGLGLLYIAGAGRMGWWMGRGTAVRCKGTLRNTSCA